VQDSLAIRRTLPFYLECPHVGTITLKVKHARSHQSLRREAAECCAVARQCMALNGVLLLGSVLFYHRGVLPGLQAYGTLVFSLTDDPASR
jgi:hypothetical protein